MSLSVFTNPVSIASALGIPIHTSSSSPRGEPPWGKLVVDPSGEARIILSKHVRPGSPQGWHILFHEIGHLIDNYVMNGPGMVAERITPVSDEIKFRTAISEMFMSSFRSRFGRAPTASILEKAYHELTNESSEDAIFCQILFGRRPYSEIFAEAFALYFTGVVDYPSDSDAFAVLVRARNELDRFYDIVANAA